MKKLMMLGCGCAALACGALEIAAWRGETVSAWVPPGEKIVVAKGGASSAKKATAPKGIHVKKGIARDVQFVTKVGSFDYASVPDRVVWGQGALGADVKRVVSVAVDADAQPGTYEFGDLKVRQPGQNLNRARVQFRLCEAIEARERSIRGILEKL